MSLKNVYTPVIISQTGPLVNIALPNRRALCYTDFIFVNRFGDPQHQGTLNKALRRIIRDCNDEILLKGKKDPLLLPHFSCHILRHSFTTRMCEAGVNVKVIQETLGHADVSTTLNIYADATKDLKKREFANLNEHWNSL